MSDFGSPEHVRADNEYRPPGMINAHEMSEKLNSRLSTNRFSFDDIMLYRRDVKPDFIASVPTGLAYDVTGDGKPDPDKLGEPFWLPERVQDFANYLLKNKLLFEHEIKVLEAKGTNDEWDKKLGYKRTKS